MRLPAPRHFRVDPRFIHATTMTSWVPTLGAKVLLVVDSAAAQDPRRRAILEASAMGAAEVRFANEAAAKEMLGRISPDDVVLVIFASLEGVEKACEYGLELKRLTIGHLPAAAGRVALHPAVHIGPADRQVIERLSATGMEIVVQPLPSDKVLPAPRATHSLPPATTLTPGRVEAKLRVVNAKGLHLRAAHQLAQLAGGLPCEVTIGSPGSMVNGKSLLGITTLGATCGTLLEVVIEGPGADASFQAVERLFESGFGEGSDWAGGDS